MLTVNEMLPLQFCLLTIIICEVLVFIGAFVLFVQVTVLQYGVTTLKNIEEEGRYLQTRRVPWQSQLLFVDHSFFLE